MSGIIAIVLLLLGPGVEAETLRVHAAASLTDVLEEVAAEYEKETGTVVRFNFGSSSMLWT